jgi:hypothetical protein
MSDENRYTIEVRDDAVEIRGTLTIREAFDFLAFFEREGFTTIEDWGDRTTLYFRKRDLKKEWVDSIDQETRQDLAFTHKQLEEEKVKSEELRIKIRELEGLIKSIMTDQSNECNRLREASKQYSKEISLLKLRINQLEENEDVDSVKSPDSSENAERERSSPCVD